MYTSKLFLSHRAVAATEHPHASITAIETLRSGGNAFDAAVAASLSLAVTQPHLGGLGGDFFALIYDAGSGRVHCLNSSGWAPSGLTVDVLKKRGLRLPPTLGPETVVIPGYLKGIGTLHEKFGTLPFTDLMTPAIKLANQGFPIYPGMVRSTKQVASALPNSAQKLYAPDSQPLQLGTLLKQEKLASTLTTIADNGIGAFYEGNIARSIIEELAKDHGPSVQLEDFASFEAEWVEPLKVKYHDCTIYEIPPNSMGATSLLLLSFLEKLKLREMRPNSHERIERTIGPINQAYTRMWDQLGDPRFANIDTARFLNPDILDTQKQSGKIARNADTTYFAVADEEGSIVSGIQSLFHHFGSRIYIDPCGFFLNNRASAFKFEGPNRLEPHKRPLHTLSTLILERENGARAAIGTSGGEFRPQQHALFLTNIMDYGMSLEKALAYPRFLWNPGSKMLIESGFSDLSSLRLDWEPLDYPGPTGVAQAIEISDGVKKGLCDIRGDGLPFGL